MTRKQKQEHKMKTEHWLRRHMWDDKKYDPARRSAHPAKKTYRKTAQATKRKQR